MRVHLPALHQGHILFWSAEGVGKLALQPDGRVVDFSMANGRYFFSDEIGRIDFGPQKIARPPSVNEPIYVETTCGDDGVERVTAWGLAYDLEGQPRYKERRRYSNEEAIRYFCLNLKANDRIRLRLGGTARFFCFGHVLAIRESNSEELCLLPEIPWDNVESTEASPGKSHLPNHQRPLEAAVIAVPEGLPHTNFPRIMARLASEIYVVR